MACSRCRNRQKSLVITEIHRMLISPNIQHMPKLQKKATKKWERFFAFRKIKVPKTNMGNKKHTFAVTSPRFVKTRVVFKKTSSGNSWDIRGISCSCWITLWYNSAIGKYTQLMVSFTEILGYYGYVIIWDLFHEARIHLNFKICCMENRKVRMHSSSIQHYAGYLIQW